MEGQAARTPKRESPAPRAELVRAEWAPGPQRITRGPAPRTQSGRKTVIQGFRPASGASPGADPYLGGEAARNPRNGVGTSTPGEPRVTWGLRGGPRRTQEHPSHSTHKGEPTQPAEDGQEEPGLIRGGSRNARGAQAEMPSTPGEPKVAEDRNGGPTRNARAPVPTQLPRLDPAGSADPRPNRELAPRRGLRRESRSVHGQNGTLPSTPGEP